MHAAAVAARTMTLKSTASASSECVARGPATSAPRTPKPANSSLSQRSAVATAAEAIATTPKSATPIDRRSYSTVAAARVA
jgi:hypothetical protein